MTTIEFLQRLIRTNETNTRHAQERHSHKHGEAHKGMFTVDRAKNRAKTFPGIAAAMADQWGGLLL